jgi:hypothetical protein
MANEKKETIMLDAESVRALGFNFAEPLKKRVNEVCDLAESLDNGDLYREMELVNILNYVSIGIKLVLKNCKGSWSNALNNKLKGALDSAQERLGKILSENSNGYHDHVLRTA